MAELSNVLDQVYGVRKEDAVRLGSVLDQVYGQDTLNEPEVGLQLGQMELGEGGLDDPGLRFEIARAIGNPSDADTKVTKFTQALEALRKTYPQADMRYVNVPATQQQPTEGQIAARRLSRTPEEEIGSENAPVTQPERNVLVFREDPSQPYRRVDERGFSPLNDIAEFFGSAGSDAGAIAGELAATFATRGMGFPARMLATMFGAGTGDLAQQAAEGHPIDTTRASSQAVIAGVGGPVVEAVSRPGIAAVTGRGLVRPSQEGARAIEAARELSDITGVDVPAPHAGLTSSSPIIRRISRQAGALVDTVHESMMATEVALRNAVDTLRAPAESSRFRSRLEATVRQQETALHNSLRLNERVDLTDAGSAVVQAAARYEETSGAHVRSMYEAAMEQAGSVDWSRTVPRLKDALVDVERGVQYMTEARERPSALLGADGNPLGTVMEEGEARRITQLKGDLQRVISQITEADPNLPAVTVDGPGGPRVSTGLDQMLAWRTQLWELKTPAPGEAFRDEHRIAARAYDAITQAIEQAGNSRSWRAATRAASERFNNLETVAMVSALKTGKTEDFARLATQLIDADPNRLLTIRRMVDNDTFGQLQMAFKNRLMQRPARIAEAMDGMDQRTLGMLLPKREQALFMQYAERMAQLKNTKDIALRYVDAGQAVFDAVSRGDAGFIRQLDSLIASSGGREGPLGRSLRAGLIDTAIDRALVRKEGMDLLDFDVLHRELSSLAQQGGSRFLGMNDIKALTSAKDVQAIMRLGADAGTSIQAAEVSKNLMEFKHGALLNMVIASGWGAVMTNPFGKKLLSGRGGKALEPSAVLSGLTAALALQYAGNDAGSDYIDDLESLLPARGAGP